MTMPPGISAILVAVAGGLSLYRRRARRHLRAAGHRERPGGAAGRQPREASSRPTRRTPTFTCGWRGSTRWRTAANATSCRPPSSPERTRNRRSRKSGSATSRTSSRDRSRPATSRTRRREGISRRSLSSTTSTVVELDATSLVGRIGYGWALEQIRRQARRDRRVPRGSSSRRGRRKQDAKFAAARAAVLHRGSGALPDSAARSQARRRRDRRAAQPGTNVSDGCRVPITPIAIPLSDSATPQDDRRSRCDGAIRRGRHRPPKRWTWISPDAGWLVYDAQAAGRITSALQWFGDVDVLGCSGGTATRRCGALDDDGDGELRGAELRHLAIWHDANGNGRQRARRSAPAQRAMESRRCPAASRRATESTPRRGREAGVRFGDGTDAADLRRHSADGR